MGDTITSTELNALINGLDPRLDTLAQIIQSTVLAQALPLVGAGLAASAAGASAWQAVQNLDNDIKQALNTLSADSAGAAAIAASALASAINDAIAQAGFSNNAQVSVSPTGVLTVALFDAEGTSYSQGLDANLGLPNMPLATSGTATASVGFTLDVVATVDLAGNFALTAPTGAAVDVAVNVTAPTFQANARLGVITGLFNADQIFLYARM
jgi:hypothetical protein